MVDFTLQDGRGQGVFAGVTADNTLCTSGRTVSKFEAESRVGNGYNFNPGNVTLTSSLESGLLYFKNNGDKDVIVDRIVYLLGTSTGGGGSDWRVRVYRNPTAGTLISSGTEFAPVNYDFGSSNVLTADSLRGAEGLTITDSDGVAFDSLLKAANVGAHFIQTSALVIPKSKSIAVTATPPAGNTSVEAQIALLLYEDTLEL